MSNLVGGGPGIGKKSFHNLGGGGALGMVREQRQAALRVRRLPGLHQAIGDCKGGEVAGIDGYRLGFG